MLVSFTVALSTERCCYSLFLHVSLAKEEHASAVRLLSSECLVASLLYIWSDSVCTATRVFFIPVFVFCIGCWLRTEHSMHIYGQLQILQHINLHLHMACGHSRHSTGSALAYRFAVCERSDGHHVCLLCTFTPVTILKNELRSRCNRIHGKRQILTGQRQRWANDAP